MDATHDQIIRRNAIKRLCDEGHSALADAFLGETRVTARDVGGELYVNIQCSWDVAAQLRQHTMTHTGFEMPGPLDRALEVTLRRWPSRVVFVVVSDLGRAA